MKKKLATGIMVTLLATTAFAQSGPDYSTSAGSASGQSPTLEKTRAQVREELFDAESAGLVPTGRTQYPPNEETIKRNQAHFGVVERYWASHR
jgi:hypothetical protein